MDEAEMPSESKNRILEAVSSFKAMHYCEMALCLPRTAAKTSTAKPIERVNWVSKF